MMHASAPRRRHLLAAAAATLVAPAPIRAQTRSLETVTVANQGPQFTYGPFYLAIHAGFFAEQGIEIQEMAQRATSISVSSVLNGDTQFGLAPTESAILANARRRPVKVVALVISGFPNLIVLRRNVAEQIARDTGVTPASPVLDRARQLKGRSFAVTSAGSSLETVLSDQARRAGLNPANDLTVTYTGSGAGTAAALRAERVDGAVTGFPFGVEALIENRVVKWIDPLSGDIPELLGMDFSMVFTRPALIGSNPDLVQRMVNAIAKAERHIQTNPDDSRAKLRQVFPNMNPAVCDLAFDTIRPLYPTTPLSTEEGYAKAMTLMNKTLPQPVNVPFAEVAETSFARRAVEALRG